MFMMRTPYISDAHTSKPTLLRKLVHFKGECRDTLSEEYKSHSCKKKKSHVSGSWEAGWWSSCTRQLLLFVSFIFVSCISHLYFCICILYLCISTFPVHGRQDGGAAAKVAGVPIAGQEK